MMISESVVSKAVRLIDEDRVDLTGFDSALVRGFTGTYEVTATPDGMECSCPARRGCSHLLASMLLFHARDILEEDHGRVTS
jgi:hypothetical protein